MAAIFSDPPMTFNLDRKSQQASDLKRSISDELRLHFVDDYSDDVLADYITVLVCNGKNQNQARDDLDAFLGDKSVDFVSWLWNLLLKNEKKCKSSASPKQLDHSAASSQNTKDVQEPQVEGISELQGPMASHICNSEILEGKENSLHDTYEYKTTVAREGLLPMKAVPSKGCINTAEFRSVQSCPHVNVHHCPCHPEESPKVHTLEKLTTEKCNDLPHVCSSLLRKDSASRNTTSLSDASHSTQCRVDAVERCDSHAAIAPLCKSNRIRRSVWDRLGPSMVTNLVKGSETKLCGEELVGQHLSYGGMADLSRGDRTISQFKEINHNDCLVPRPAATNKRGRKRHFDEVTAGPGASVTKKNVDSSRENVAVAQAGKRQLPTMNRARATDSVHNVKARLHHIEKEVSMLREKHVENEKQGSQILGAKCGSQKPLQEDIESRSVLVTNVHFVATKEALFLYFGKCGRIIGVFLVSDDGSFFSRRPRSACITFANKESADKALELSGMPFYSRNIKVVRLVEKVALSSLSIPVGAKPAESHVSRIKKSIRPNIPLCPSNRLQWRRESAGPVSSVPPAGSINPPKVVPASASMPQQYVASPFLMRGKSGEHPRKSNSDKSGDETSASLSELYVAPPLLMKEKLGEQQWKFYSDKAQDEMSASVPKLSVAPQSLLKEMSLEQQKKSNSDKAQDETSASLPELHVAPSLQMEDKPGEQQQKPNSDTSSEETSVSLPQLAVAPTLPIKEDSGERQQAADSGEAQTADMAPADGLRSEQQCSSSLISARTEGIAC